MDYDHTPAALMCRHAEKISQPAYLVYGNVLAGLFAGFAIFAIKAECFGLQQTKVGVCALLKPVAGRAYTAGKTGIAGMLAQQTLSVSDCKVEFAYPFGSLEQQAMRRAFAQLLQASPVSDLPLIYFIHIKYLKSLPQVYV
jgi:hypothetical protein